MSKLKERPVIQYFGGKFKIAKWIISHFPEHRVYTEAFGGGANILLRKNKSDREVYNDLDSNIVNVFKVLRDKDMSNELKRRLYYTPYSRQDFNESHNDSEVDIIERVRHIFIKSYLGRGHDAVTINKNKGFRSSTSNKSPHYARNWSIIHKYINDFHERFKDVIIENRNAVDVLSKYDSIDTLHYIDPPYVHSTRSENNNYRFEMTDEDHINLYKSILNLSGNIIISGYESSLYNDLYRNWHKVSLKTYSDGFLPRNECLWMRIGNMDDIQLSMI